MAPLISFSRSAALYRSSRSNPKSKRLSAGGFVYIVGIDEDQPVRKALRVVWCELCQAGDGPQHVALAVDDDEGAVALPEFVEVHELEVLEELGFAVPGPSHDVRMLEACPEGDRKGERRL